MNCTVLGRLGSVHICYLILFCAGSVRRFLRYVLSAKLSLRSSNNAYFLPLIYFCPGKEIQVMSAVPGIELLGPYRRIYDKSFIHRITIDCGPQNVLAVNY
jgi:hypothetical protein